MNGLFDILVVTDEARDYFMDEKEKWDETKHPVINPKWVHEEGLEGHEDFILNIRGERGLLGLKL